MKRLAILIIFVALSLLVSRDGFAQAKVVRSVSNAMVEKILQGLELKYQKDERKDKDNVIMFFDFKRGDQPMRLYNYGNDLWIECTFEKKLKRDDVNRWNSQAKFSRLVLIESKDKTILSLESQLDCLGGVTEAIITQYINRFEDETKKFVKFAK